MEAIVRDHAEPCLVSPGETKYSEVTARVLTASEYAAKRLFKK